MVHLWGSRTREEAEMSKSALGANTPGDIAVVIGGEKLDSNLVFLGCQMAKGAKRKVHLVHVIEVPRALPLKAVLTQESERADELLKSALHIADRVVARQLQRWFRHAMRAMLLWMRRKIINVH